MFTKVDDKKVPKISETKSPPKLNDKKFLRVYNRIFQNVENEKVPII